MIVPERHDEWLKLVVGHLVEWLLIAPGGDLPGELFDLCLLDSLSCCPTAPRILAGAITRRCW